MTMNFDEATQRYTTLRQQYDAGQIDWNGLVAATGNLRLQDAEGRWWQIEPAGGIWHMWDGRAWVTTAGQPTGASPGAVPADPAASAGNVRKGNKQKKPLAQRSQKWWDAVSIVGGVVAAILWLMYTGLPASSEGVDIITPILMVAIPTGLVFLRKPIDGLLKPIQPVRRHIPRLFLIGGGLVAPYVVAWLLYDAGFRQYEYMWVSLICGSLTAYAILRTPEMQSGGPADA